MPGLIAGADPHQLWFECLGPDHAEDELEVVEVGDQDMAEATPPTVAIPAVRVMARFAEEEEDDIASSVSDTSGSGIVARYPAVCGGIVATDTESESSGGRNGRYSEGAGPHGDLISRRAPPR